MLIKYACMHASMGDSSLRCSRELLDELHERKERDETYEDYIWRVLGRLDDRETDAREEPVSDPEPAREDVHPIEDVQVDPEPRDPGDVSVKDIDVPGSGSRERARQETVMEIYERLQELETATKDELLESVEIDLDAVDYEKERWFWKKCISGSGLGQLPGVESPGAGGGSWNYEAE